MGDGDVCLVLLFTFYLLSKCSHRKVDQKMLKIDLKKKPLGNSIESSVAVLFIQRFFFLPKSNRMRQNGTIRKQAL